MVPLRHNVRIWDRTHGTLECRVGVVPPRDGRARTTGVSAILAWVQPGDVIESRYLAAGLPASLPWSTRMKRVRKFITRGLASGLFVDVETVRYPSVAYAPSPAFSKRYDIPVPRLRRLSAGHSALAIEAGLMLAEARAGIGLIVGVVGDAALSSRARNGRTNFGKGARFDAIPDAHVVIDGARDVHVEVISTEYRRQQIAEKFAAMSYRVDFVCTSRTLAGRFARINAVDGGYFFT